MTIHRQKTWIAGLVLLTLATLAFGQTAAPLPADLDPVSRARLPYLERKDDVDGKAQRLYDTFRPADGVLKGPLAFAAYNPAVAVALLDLHNAAVAPGPLDAHVRELAILVACRETNYNLEWNGHERSALRAGVDAKVIDIVRNNRPLTGVDERDATVIRFGRQLLNDRKMDSATFARAVQLFGKRGATDLVAVMTTYAASGFYAIAVDEHMAPGTPVLPPK
jgi:4-carboxymuconolactone decarboxylase